MRQPGGLLRTIGGRVLAVAVAVAVAVAIAAQPWRAGDRLAIGDR